MDLVGTLQALSDGGYRPAKAAVLRNSLEAAVTALDARIRRDVPAFVQAADGDAATASAMAAHLHDQLVEIHRLIGGSNWPQLEFVRRHAGAVADGGNVPLADLLRAYRAMGPALRHWLVRPITAGGTAGSEHGGGAPAPGTGSATGGHPVAGDVAAAIDAFVTCWIDAVSSAATEEYVRRTRQQAEAGADSRAHLLSALLAGGGDGDGAGLLQASGYLAQPAVHCVILAQPRAEDGGAGPVSVDHLLAATRQALSGPDLELLHGLRDGLAVIIASAVGAGHQGAGAKPGSGGLPARVGWALLRHQERLMAGISAEAHCVSRIPLALEEAALALQLTTPRERVVRYDEIPLRRLLLHLAAERAASALPSWMAAFAAVDGKSGGRLSATLRGYADADMNVLKAAKALGVHPNTIYGRMQKIRELTGLDPTRFGALNELLLAIDCAARRPSP